MKFLTDIVFGLCTCFLFGYSFADSKIGPKSNGRATPRTPIEIINGFENAPKTPALDRIREGYSWPLGSTYNLRDFHHYSYPEYSGSGSRSARGYSLLHHSSPATPMSNLLSTSFQFSHPATGPTPSLAPSVAPTPTAGLDLVYMARTTLGGISLSNFSDDAQLAFRKTVATTLSLNVEDIEITSVTEKSSRRMLLRGPPERQPLQQTFPWSQYFDQLKRVKQLQQRPIRSNLQRQDLKQEQKQKQEPQQEQDQLLLHSDIGIVSSYRRRLAGDGVAVEWQARIPNVEPSQAEGVSNSTRDTMKTATNNGAFLINLAATMDSIQPNGNNVYNDVTSVQDEFVGFSVGTQGPTPSPTKKTAMSWLSNDKNIGAIVGIVIAAVVLLLLLAFLIYWFCCRTERKHLPVPVPVTETQIVVRQSEELVVRPSDQLTVRPPSTVADPSASSSVPPPAPLSPPIGGGTATVAPVAGGGAVPANPNVAPTGYTQGYTQGYSQTPMR